ncbi:hypothetical protein H1R20_g11404, partial [Candolleomyces eurysporus]
MGSLSNLVSKPSTSKTDSIFHMSYTNPVTASQSSCTVHLLPSPSSLSLLVHRTLYWKHLTD